MIKLHVNRVDKSQHKAKTKEDKKTFSTCYATTSIESTPFKYFNKNRCQNLHRNVTFNQPETITVNTARKTHDVMK